MGLFKTKKSSAIPLQDESSPTRKKTSKFPFTKQKKQRQHQKLVSDVKEEQRESHREAVEEEEDYDLGDIPRSISTPSRDGSQSLPPLPATPKDDINQEGREDVNNDDDDSIGSPCGAMIKNQQKLNQMTTANKANAKPIITMSANKETLARLHAITSSKTASLNNLQYYIAALSPTISPDSSADLPSRALRCLFSLSEHSSHKQQRIAMVRDNNNTSTGQSPNGKSGGSSSLIPALLSFLKRCPRDSSEQYLTLLVLNNLSIPAQNKQLIALKYGGVQTLAKLLREDPGCHLLVIIIVNLTFGDDKLNGDLLMDGNVQLVDSLAYALLLASLTEEQLATLGPISLNSPEGAAYTPHKLLSILFSSLESKLGIEYQNTSLYGNDCPFIETAKWCLSALKNLTRPGSKSNDASEAASRAILDAGILPLLLRILKHKEDISATSADSAGKFLYNWQSNSAQDAALYTLMHMSCVPQVRRALREDYDGCVEEVLVSILNYGESINSKLLKPELELGQISLQCLKARMALSYFIQDTEEYNYAITLAGHETHSLVELLSHCLQSRAKDGIGGYSAATFALKSVLYVINCILSEPKNREVFASTGSACRLNALLLKVVARYSLLDKPTDTLDAEDVENAVMCIFWMSLYGLDETVVGYSLPLRQGIFLPATFGDAKAKKVVAKVLVAYLNKDGISCTAQRATKQLLLSLNFLRFEGSAADMTYGEPFPNESDFDFDDKLLAALKTNKGEEWRKKGNKPKKNIFDRPIARQHANADAKAFSSGVAGPHPALLSWLPCEGPDAETYPSALIAAEELAAEQPEGTVHDTIAMANDIAFYADGFVSSLDVYYGFIWKWETGEDLFEQIYTAAAETEEQRSPPEEVVDDVAERSRPYSPPRKGFLGRLIPDEDYSPVSIFGLKCRTCGRCGGKNYSVLDD